MTSIHIVFRPSSRVDSNSGHLNLRLIHKRKAKLISTGIKILSNEWDDIKKEIKISVFDNERNNYLKQIKHQLTTKILQLTQLQSDLSSKGDYNLEILTASYNQYKAKNSFLLFGQSLSRDLMKQDRLRTAEAYQSVIKRLIRFSEEKDFSLEDINQTMVENFERSLKNDGLRLNTISFYMRNLRAIYNRAIRERHLPTGMVNPFLNVYTGVQVTRKRALSKEEMNKIYTLDLDQVFENKKNRTKLENLSQARDFFLFSFYARGMSFVDLAYLKKTDIRDGILTYYRKKTGQQLEVKITKQLRTIIQRYTLQTEKAPYLFPIIKDITKPTRQQYLNGLRTQNSLLNELKNLTDIQKHISAHVARHTWATIAKEEQLPIWTISESLGHSSVKTTYIYLASINRSLLDKANDRVTKAVGI